MKLIIRFFVVMLMATFFLFCQSEISTEQSRLSGETLAKKYCSSCHIFPSPDLLDHFTWKNYILPRMGNFMGIYLNDLQRDSLIEKGSEAILYAANIFPNQALLSNNEWKEIQTFYLEQAPKELASTTPIISTQTTRFKPEFPDLFMAPPSLTYTSIEKNAIRIADANKGVFMEVDQNFEIKKQAKIGEGLVHLKETEVDIWMTVMGNFSPSEQANGYVLKLSKTTSTLPQKIITQLQRPVHTSYADFNNDGKMDLLISEYGKWTGGLSLFIQQENGTLKKQVLLNRSGAIKTEVVDYNEDGLFDILALFGQGDEGFVLLTNKGNGQFEPKPLLKLHPSMGSSYFSLEDIDGDDKKEIIYTAGDNADFPSIPKPYHGVYIFKQTENFNFIQSAFLPFHGAYKAIPADYDQDGDIDIAAISFFPDYRIQQDQTFVLFENSHGKYTPKTLDLKNAGRWITFDAGDIDQDGDLDLILGSLTFEVPEKPALINQWINNGLPFIILKNQNNK